MRVIRLQYKSFRFEMESAGIFFTIGTLFLSGGIAMLTENVWIYLFETASEILLKKEESWTSEFIGAGLLAIGFGFVWLGIRNKRLKVYEEIYQKVYLAVNELFTTLNIRAGGFNREIWTEQYNKTWQFYMDGTSFIDLNKLRVKETVADEAREILKRCALEMQDFLEAIELCDKWLKGALPPGETYDPLEVLRYSRETANEILDDFDKLKVTLREKLSMRLD